MATHSVYGFISDELFWNKKSIDLDTSVDTGVGYINDLLINFFDKIARVTDNRSTRLSILNEVPTNKEIQIIFDFNKIEKENLFFQSIDNDTIGKLFNITEKIYLTQNRTEEELNDTLMTDTNFSIYVNNSIRLGSTWTNATAFLTTETVIKIYDFIEFSINVNDQRIHFKLWLTSSKFKAQYPLSTIKDIISPCDPQYLLDPSKLKSPIDSIIKSSDYALNSVDMSMTADDQTGCLPYSTKWVISSQQILNIKFGVAYKGAKPSSLEVRKALREWLLNTGLGSTTIWENRFPDLFVTAQFFITPMWDNLTPRTDRVLYPSIIGITMLTDKLRRYYPAMTSSHIEDYAELIINAHNKLFSLVLPDPLNEDNKFSLLKLLPTYQNFSSQDAAFVYQEERAKDFNFKFNRCMSTLFGETVSGEFVENIFFDRNYLSFVSHNVEYHVMTKDSYITNAP